MSTTLVVPCYNEAERLPRAQFIEFAETHEVKLLFVDDGSRDRTANVIDEMLSPKLELLRLSKNVGKGEAVRRGLLHAISKGAEMVGYVDADLATPLEDVWAMLDYFADPGILGVTGARVHLFGSHIERRAVRHYAGRMFATAASKVLGKPYYDTQCGAKVFRVHAAIEAALAAPFTSPWIFDVELLGRIFAEARERGLPGTILREHPVRQWRDVNGSHVRLSAFLRAPVELLNIALELRRR